MTDTPALSSNTNEHDISAGSEDAEVVTNNKDLKPTEESSTDKNVNSKAKSPTRSPCPQ